jgi:HSP20 family protein
VIGLIGRQMFGVRNRSDRPAPVALADKAFEVTAELPGLDVKNIDLQLSDLVLTIKGEKQED